MLPVRSLLGMITLFLLSMSTTATLAAAAAAAEAVPIAKPNCTSKCADVDIPYPFGIEEGCYINDWFKVMCEATGTVVSTGAKIYTPSLEHANLDFIIRNISLDGTIQVANSNLTLYSNKDYGNCTDAPVPPSQQPVNLTGSPFVYSEKNRLVLVGCSGVNFITLFNGSKVGGCLAICDGSEFESETIGDCNGINCCTANLPPHLTAFNYSYQAVNTTPETDYCKQVLLVDQDWEGYSYVQFNSMVNMVFPILFDWKLSDYSVAQIHGTVGADKFMTCNDSSCVCLDGYQGNPYLANGCQDINECEDPNICRGASICHNYSGGFECRSPLTPVKLAFIVVGSVLGALLILICVWRLHYVIKKRKDKKRKEKFFKQNGGLLLEKQSTGDAYVERIRLFSAEELEKATDNYNSNRILGKGGHGTVYKGMLADGSIVAIKKSTIADEGEIQQFINEIVVLSQIMHRNVVRLMGCCLETEVPLLVYEFILNGTLSQYIHHQNEEFPFTWGMRLQASIEVAGALAYLHSGTSFPIYHRDIKSSNILLDDKFRAKVADFGTSRTVAIDKTHLTMSQLQGTFGYLDPEYFQTSQFTDKSDVYSFGVVLVELLTGQKPVSQTGPDEWRNLTSYFLLSMEEDRLLEILDSRIKNEGGKEDIIAVAQLARRCLNIDGKKRPTMKEVAVQLEGILSQSSAKGFDVYTNPAEVGYVLHRRHVDSTSQYNTMSITIGSPSDSEPLLSF